MFSSLPVERSSVCECVVTSNGVESVCVVCECLLASEGVVCRMIGLYGCMVRSFYLSIKHKNPFQVISYCDSQ